MSSLANRNGKRRWSPPLDPDAWSIEIGDGPVVATAIHFKKILMAEWRGTANIAALEELRVALSNAAKAVRPELARIR